MAGRGAPTLLLLGNLIPCGRGGGALLAFGHIGHEAANPVGDLVPDGLIEIQSDPVVLPEAAQATVLAPAPAGLKESPGGACDVEGHTDWF